MIFFAKDGRGLAQFCARELFLRFSMVFLHDTGPAFLRILLAPHGLPSVFPFWLHLYLGVACKVFFVKPIFFLDTIGK